MSEMQRAADDLRLRNGDPEFLLGMVRQFVDMEPDAKQFPSQLRELRIFFRALDDHLSAGGNPPEAWREGPDAVGASQDEAAARLEYLRGEIRAERISYGEIAELQGLASFIDAGDVELLEWAGVPEAAPGGRDDDYTPEAMDRTDVATADEARQAAMEWQARSADRGMSYGELAEWQGYFSQLGERFGLTAEFRENGII